MYQDVNKWTARLFSYWSFVPLTPILLAPLSLHLHIVQYDCDIRILLCNLQIFDDFFAAAMHGLVVA